MPSTQGIQNISERINAFYQVALLFFRTTATNSSSLLRKKMSLLSSIFFCFFFPLRTYLNFMYLAKLPIYCIKTFQTVKNKKKFNTNASMAHIKKLIKYLEGCLLNLLDSVIKFPLFYTWHCSAGLTGIKHSVEQL